jgi:hypothetical protein
MTHQMLCMACLLAAAVLTVCAVVASVRGGR